MSRCDGNVEIATGLTSRNEEAYIARLRCSCGHAGPEREGIWGAAPDRRAHLSGDAGDLIQDALFDLT